MVCARMLFYSLAAFFIESLIAYKVVIGYFQTEISSMTFIVGIILFAIGMALPAKAISGEG